jgi:hypothetical protein
MRDLVTATFSLYSTLLLFDLWTHLFEHALWLIPYLMFAPALFSNQLDSEDSPVLTLGVMMQAVHVYDQVASALSLPAMHWSEVSELASVMQRLYRFEERLKSAEDVRTANTNRDNAKRCLSEWEANRSATRPKVGVSQFPVGTDSSEQDHGQATAHETKGDNGEGDDRTFLRAALDGTTGVHPWHAMVVRATASTRARRNLRTMLLSNEFVKWTMEANEAPHGDRVYMEEARTSVGTGEMPLPGVSNLRM